MPGAAPSVESFAHSARQRLGTACVFVWQPIYLWECSVGRVLTLVHNRVVSRRLDRNVSECEVF
jgi:hypothetical protein